MSFLSRFLPGKDKNKPVELKNNIPKEKESIKKTFAVYCHAHHDTEGAKLCGKCSALLATILTKIDRCPYGITKPICDQCDRPCFSPKQTKEFLEIMSSNQGRMFLKHPIMAIRHKFAKLGSEYAQFKRQKTEENKAKAREKNAQARKERKSKEKEKKED